MAEHRSRKTEESPVRVRRSEPAALPQASDHDRVGALLRTEREGIPSAADAHSLQRLVGNRGTSRLLRTPGQVDGRVHPLRGTGLPSSASGPLVRSPRVVQAKFSQDPGAGDQQSHHGGVKSDYTYATNMVELHIEAGANRDGNLIPDFLAALWEAQDAITAGQGRAVGGVFMRPGGAKVLKMTMEMLGEALGAAGPDLDGARASQAARRAAGAPLGVGIPPNRIDDTLDATFVAEHIGYRNSLVGVPGVDMMPIGQGTQGGTVDMLAPANAAERTAYDNAVTALTPFMSIAITVNLANLNQIVASIERQIPRLKLLGLKAKYLLVG